MIRQASDTPLTIRRAMVLGGGPEAQAVAEQLVQDNFNVVLVGDVGAYPLPKEVEALPDAAVDEVRGFAGAFEVVLRSPDGRRRERVDAIVAAQPARRVPKFQAYGLGPSERVVSLSDLEGLLDTGGGLPEPGGPWFHAVFLLGLEGGSDTSVFVRAFDCMDRLQDRGQVQAYVFTRHVKVADDNLERRYRDLRQKGVLFFKFDSEECGVYKITRGEGMAFQDPLLGTDMELRPDLVVVDEDIRPPSDLESLLDAIPSSGVFRPYLQPDSPRFLGVETPKAGILAVGAAKGRFFPDSLAADVQAVSVQLRAMGGRARPADLPGPAEVDPARCTLCLTCVRLCPHGAIGFGAAAEVDPVSCVGCGICAVECPMRAIVMAPSLWLVDIRGRIDAGLSDAGVKKRIVAFLCRRSAMGAMAAAGAASFADLLTVEVQCAGTVDPAHMLHAFQQGAEGVLVAGCHKGNCASIYGTDLARSRASMVGTYLQEAGIDPGRLLFTALASNTPGELVRAVRDLRSGLV